MQKINREDMLRQLEAVSPGLSNHEIIEQSSCFVFNEGHVFTFNDEICCRIKTSLDFTGAITAKPLLSILRKFKETDLKIESKAEEVMLQGKRGRAGIKAEASVNLPIKVVDEPEKWKDLHSDFIEGLRIVQQAVSKDDSHFALTCVHITDSWVEASDNYQITRVNMKTGFKTNSLIKKDALKDIIDLDMSEFSETAGWLHFKNSAGLILSCRRYESDFPNLSPYLKKEGDPMTLPKGLSEAAEKASVFSSDTSDDNHVLIELRSDKLRIKGYGAYGWFTEVKKIRYEGKNLSFLIAPDLLIELIKKHNECLISKDKLMIDGGNFKYVTSLGTAKD